MIIACPNLNNPQVAKDFNELVAATSEKAAYAIWSLNNGNMVDKAPNGEPSILFQSLLQSFDGDRQKAIIAKAKVYTDSFREWFGDWTQDDTTPIVDDDGVIVNGVSQIVDKNGEPLVVYHGTSSTFNEFRTRSEYVEEEETLDGGLIPHFYETRGSFFTTDQKYARIYGSITMPCFLNIKEAYGSFENPVDNLHSTGATEIFNLAELENAKTDGIIGHDVDTFSHDEYSNGSHTWSEGFEFVIKDPNQVKSSVDNNGDFSTTDNNIYHNLNVLAKRITSGAQLKQLLSDILTKYFHFHRYKGDVWKTLSQAKKNLYASQLKYTLDAFGISEDAVDYSNGTLEFDEDILQDDVQTFRDSIGHIESESVFEKIRMIQFFQQKFPQIKGFEFVTGVDYNGMFKDGIVYLNANTFMDVTAEECLHPFVEALYQENNELFNQLLSEAKRDFKELRANIANTYNNKKGFTPEDRHKELVTQALSRHFAEVWEEHNNPRKENKSIWTKAWDWILDKLGIGDIANLPKDMTMRQLAEAIFNANNIKIDDSYFNSTAYNLVTSDDISNDTIDNVIRNLSQDKRAYAALQGQFDKYCKDNGLDPSDENVMHDFYSSKIAEAIETTKANLAEFFDLQKDDDGTYYASNNSERDQLKAQFVNTISERINDPYYSRFVVRILNELVSGRYSVPDTNSYQIIRIWLDIYRSNELVMAAQNTIGGPSEQALDIIAAGIHSQLTGTRTKKGKTLLGGALAGALTASLPSAVALATIGLSTAPAAAVAIASGAVIGVAATKLYDILDGIVNIHLMFHNLFSKDKRISARKQRMEIVKQLNIIQASNTSLATNESAIINILKEKGVQFNFREKNVRETVTAIRKLLQTKLEALKGASRYRQNQIQIDNLQAAITRLKSYDVSNIDEQHEIFFNFLNDAFAEVQNAIQWLDKNKLELDEFGDIVDIDKAETINFVKLRMLRTDVIAAYDNIIRSKIANFMFNSNDPEFQGPDGSLYQSMKQLQSIIQDAETKFDNLQHAYIRYRLNEFCDREMGIGGNVVVKYLNGNPVTLKDVFKENVMLLLDNKYSIGQWHEFLDNSVMYGNASKNQIVRIADKFIREFDQSVRVRADKKSRKLIRLIKKASKFYHNPCSIMVELDNGVPTGNFTTAVNVGQYENQRIQYSRNVYNDYMVKLVDDLKYMQDHIDEIFDGATGLYSSNDRISRIIDDINDSPFVTLLQSGNFLSYLKSAELEVSYNEDTEDVESEDSYIMAAYQEKMDRFYDGRKHRRYTSDYYITRRRYLSPDTEEIIAETRKRIFELSKSAYDKEVGYTIISKLDDVTRDEIRKLNRKLNMMSSIYNIEFDDLGNVSSVRVKTGDDLRMALELQKWQEAKREKIRSSEDKDVDKYNQIYEAIKQKYGEDSEELKDFIDQATYRSVRYDEVDADIEKYRSKRLGKKDKPELEEELSKLRKRKSDILKYTKEKSVGYYDPNLRKLNDEAFEELKRIDERIESINKELYYYDESIEEDQLTDDEKNERDAIRRRKLIETPESIATKEAKKQELGEDTDEYAAWLAQYQEDTYYDELQRKYESEGRQAEFIDRYHYTHINHEGQVELRPLSAFYKSEYGQQYIYDELSYEFNTVDMDSEWIDSKYDPEDEFDNIDSVKYYNEAYSEILGNTHLYKLYKEMLSTMEEAWDMLPQNRRHYKYMMPQQVSDNYEYWGTRMFFRPFRNLKSRKFAKVDGKSQYDKENGVSVNNTTRSDYEEFASRPDGTEYETIPIRWVKKLGINAKYINTDLGKTVSMFYEMACNYEMKSEGLALLETLQDAVRGGFAKSGNNNAANRIKTMMTAYGYGRQRLNFINGGKLTSFERHVDNLSARLMSVTHSSYMINNLKSMGKNAADSTESFIALVGAGKHMTIGDALSGIAFMMRHPKIVRAMLRYNGAHENIAYSSEKSYWPKLLRGLSHFTPMNFFIGIDYTFKAAIASMAYNHYRLVEDPNTKTMRYMTKDEAIYTYIGTKGGKSLGKKLWRRGSKLKDAYYLDYTGHLAILPDMIDYIKPPTIDNFEEKREAFRQKVVEKVKTKYTDEDEIEKHVNWEMERWEEKHRSQDLETKISGYINERAGVINGMFTNYSKNKTFMNMIGAQAFMMRGWAVTQLIDHLKTGDDFILKDIDDTADLEDLGRRQNIHSMYYNTLNPDILKLSKEFEGQYNFSTGFLEKGEWNEYPVKKLYTGFRNIIKYFTSNKDKRILRNMVDELQYLGKQACWSFSLGNTFKNGVTEHTKYAIKSFTCQILVILLNMMLSFPLGWWVEAMERDVRDPKGNTQRTKAILAKEDSRHKTERWVAWVLYTINTGVQTERISQLGPFGFMITFFEFVKAPFISEGWIERYLDGVKALRDLITDGLDEKEVTGQTHYRHMKTWQKNASVASWVAPIKPVRNLGINNLTKSINISSYDVTSNFYYNATAPLFQGYKPNFTGDTEQNGSYVNKIGSWYVTEQLSKKFGRKQTITPKKESSGSNRGSINPPRPPQPPRPPRPPRF